ncbi:MAG: biotin--[acetyl-CoA-carboxylase] ligase [Acidimicrobiales bacterium]
MPVQGGEDADNGPADDEFHRSSASVKRAPAHTSRWQGPSDGRAESVSAQLGDTMFGPVEWVDETGSTNEDLLSRATQGASPGLVRVADHQTAGRGRRDRTWTDTSGQSLLMSVLLRPSMDPERLSVLTAAFAVATAEACDALGCPGSRIKWPNDLVVGPVDGQRKLAGILAQSRVGSDGTAVVIGLGLNVESGGVPALANPAAALDELGVAPGRDELAVRILRNADRLLRSLDDAPELMWERYRGRSATLGTVVEVQLDDGLLTGLAAAVNESGALMVGLPGETVEIVAGDVVSVAVAPAGQA